MKERLKSIIKFLLFCLIMVFSIKFFIYSLPFILVVLLIYWIYSKLRGKYINRETFTNKREKHNVMEAEIVCERNEGE